HLRVFVELAADAVPHEVAHDRVAVRLDNVLHRLADVRDAPPRPALGDRALERPLRDLHELLRLVAHLPDRDRARRVSNIPFVDDAEVEADDVALLQHLLLRRDPVHYLLVDARAQVRRIAEIALEHALPATLLGVLVGDAVEIGRADAGLHHPREAL